MKRLLAFIVVAIVAVSIGIAIVGDYLDLGKQLAAEEGQRKELLSRLVPALVDELRSRIKVSLKIYKNGELVYYDPDDPITVHWLWFVADVLLGCFYMGCAQPFKAESGATYKYADFDYHSTNPIPILAIGNGTTPASPSDYKLESQLMSQQLDSGSVIVNDTGTSYVIAYRYTFALSQDANISEAGLLIKGEFCGTATSCSYNTLLVARDTFTPISLAANESISVEYVVTLDYSSPPFTRKFWILLGNYFLGLKAVGRSLGNVAMDTSWDSLVSGAHSNSVSEKILFAYALESFSWSPDVSISSTSPKWSPRRWTVSVDESGLSIDAFVIQEDTANTYKVYGIVFYLQTDGNDGSGYSIVYHDIIVIPLDAAITVDWSMGFFVEAGLQIT